MTKQETKAGSVEITATPMAWFAWFLGALFYCYGYFQRVAPSVMVTDLMSDFQVSGAILGNLTAFYFYAYASLQIPFGVLIDRYGPRRMLAAAALLCGAGSLLFAVAPNVQLAYAGRFLVGAGAGVAWLGTLQICGQMLPASRFAQITGFTLLIGMAGGIGGQAPLAQMIDVAGWRTTMGSAAIGAVILAVLIWFFVPRTTRSYGGDAPAGKTGIVRGLKEVLANSQSWTCGLFGGMLGVSVLAFGGLWCVPYMMATYGLSRPAAALTATLMLVGWAIGAPLAGWVSDRMGRRKAPMLVGGIGGLATLSCALYLPGLPLIAVQGLLLIHGIFSGAMVLCFATGRENNGKHVAATSVSFVNMAVMGTSACFQPLIGALLDLGWDGRMVEGARIYSVENFKTALLVLIAAGVVACLAAVLTRETNCKQVERS
ncbi:MAG: MFS transporter [Rhodospirillales bacterium]|nr:MFS transporter [Rhodospirillales bacterium]